MCSGGGDEQLRSTGFPIRKSPDRSLVADSPGLIAASYVLLRLLVPRHPPCALNNLTTKMLASTVQFSRCGRGSDSTSPRTPLRGCRSAGVVPQRVGALRAPGPSGPNSVRNLGLIRYSFSTPQSGST